MPSFLSEAHAADVVPAPEALADLAVGVDDLIDVRVYDAPEFSGRFRLNREGAIELPMLRQPVPVAGLRSSAIASHIADALRTADLLTHPVVSVSVLEFRSRQVTVAGAVNKPGLLQVNGRMTLLDALSMCGGLSSTAGPDILIDRPTSDGPGTGESKDVARAQSTAQSEARRPITTRVAVRALMINKDPSANPPLAGGENIRVPEAGKVFVLGNIKKPGVIEIHDAAQTSVLRVLAVSEGVSAYASNTAYIYRSLDGTGDKKELPVPLKKIIDRKAEDVSLLPGDIFYIPDNTGRRNRAQIFERTMALGGGVSSAIIYAGVH